MSTIVVNGEKVSATRMEIVKSEERTNEYLLENNTVLRVKCPLVDVWRIDGQQDADGHPVYQVSTQLIVRAEAEE